MRSRWIGYGLLGLAGLMLIGFLRSNLSLSAPATLVALLIVVVLPTVGGIAMIRGIGSRDRARVGVAAPRSYPPHARSRPAL